MIIRKTDNSHKDILSKLIKLVIIIYSNNNRKYFYFCKSLNNIDIILAYFYPIKISSVFNIFSSLKNNNSINMNITKKVEIYVVLFIIAKTINILIHKIYNKKRRNFDKNYNISQGMKYVEKISFFQSSKTPNRNTKQVAINEYNIIEVYKKIKKKQNVLEKE